MPTLIPENRYGKALISSGLPDSTCISNGLSGIDNDVKRDGNFNKSPIIHDSEALFFYKGDAETIYLVGDYNRWEREDRMVYDGQAHLWSVQKHFPRNARFEYKYVVDGKWIKDPMNPAGTPGENGNSILVMPEYRIYYDEIISQPVPRGTLFRDLGFDSVSLSKRMKYHLYLPPNYQEGRCSSVLYALDGSDYLNYAKLDRVLDCLIAREEIPEVAAVLIDPDERDRDFTIYEPYRDYVIHELIPNVEREHLVLAGSSVNRAIMGVSWGGLTAIYLAVSQPYLFAGVLSQSGSFWPKDWRMFELVKSANTPPIRFCLQAGTIQDTEEMNDAMAETLKGRGYPINYTKYAESHNWSNWKGHLDEGLKSLYCNAKRP